MKLSQQKYHGACGLKSAVQGCGRRFRPMAEVSFPGRALVSQADPKRQETSASEE